MDQPPETYPFYHERTLGWFYDGATADCTSIEPAAIKETLRTFSGNEGVLGALGVYRAAFTTIAQTEPLKANKVKVPVVALGGDKALGASVQEMAALVAENITGGVVTDCGHFIPEERPDEVVRQIQAMLAKGDI